MNEDAEGYLKDILGDSYGRGYPEEARLREAIECAYLDAAMVCRNCAGLSVEYAADAIEKRIG